VADGHTKEGAWIVHLELSEDQVQQLARLLDMAKMMNGDHIEHQFNDYPKETFDIIGRSSRRF
jgi:hypothetical protein